MTQPVITLTILTKDFEEFKRQAITAASFLDYIQIDVMDGQFVPNTSFPERDEINSLNLPLRYELHLMVKDPVAEMRRWKNVDNVFRVLFHFEANPEDVSRPISFARREGWDVGLAINPETPLSAVERYLDRVDVVQFMTIHPGRQGAAFEPKVLKKIKQFSHLRHRPLCAVDGGVNPDTIKSLKKVGVQIFNVGSFFTRAPDMKQAYEELQKVLQH